MNRPRLAQRGTTWRELEEELHTLRREDIPWRKGIFFSNWPNPGNNIHLAAKEAGGIFFNQLVIGRRFQASARKLAADLQGFTLSLFNAADGAVCTLTAGGTESNFHAVKVARDKARALRPGLTAPELVVPATAHPSFDKAGSYMQVKIVRVPVRDDFRADVDAMAAAITDRTVGLVGSSPPYPHGQCDEIGAIAQLARERGLWCHVDSCVGGFLIPFLHRLGHSVPPFDFSVDGVRSISADLHKFGYAPTGISTFSLCDGADLQYQVFAANVWASGEYVTQTLAGSYSAAPIAAAWTVMRMLGVEGYLEIARGICATAEKLRAGIEAIDGLRVLAEPEAGILIFGSDTLSIDALAAQLKERGFMTSLVLEPRAVHLLLDPMEDPGHHDDYLAALADAAAAVRRGAVAPVGAKVTYA